MRTWRMPFIVRPTTWLLTFTLIWMQVSPSFALGLEINRRNAEHETAKLHWGMPSGLTQTLTSKQLAIVARNRGPLTPNNGGTRGGRADRPDVRVLTHAEMRRLHGSGVYRNFQYAGQAPPWQRSFHDVNVCNGNLFKTFTDMQIAPARGAGLVLQRTYSSQDPRIGPFGVGWTHAYDIRNVEATGNNTDSFGFFGRSDTYHRDADGLYSAPVFKHDLLSSNYGTTLVNGQYPPLADTDTGLDGTVKHYFTNGPERDCDYIQDRHGNTTTLTYGSQTDQTGRQLLQSVTDPSCRSIVFTWSNIGTTANPAWRVTQVQGPLVNGAAVAGVTYIVQYNYYTSTSDPNAADDLYNLQSVTLDPTGLNRTTSYTYTHVTGVNGTENALLASITDPLGEVTSYTYAVDKYPSNITWTPTYGDLPAETNSAWVFQVTEPAGIDTSGNPRTITWNIAGYGESAQLKSEGYGGEDVTFITNNLSSLDNTGDANTILIQLITDPYLRFIQLNNYMTSNDDALKFGCQYNASYDQYSNVTEHDQYGGGYSGYPNSPDPDLSNGWSWTQVSNVYTYGATANVLTHSYLGATPQDVTAYYGANEYFQKQTDTDMNSHTTIYTYGTSSDQNLGNRGSTLTVTDANNGQTSYTYNQYGQKLTETNANGIVTQYTYGDQFGNLTQVVQDTSSSNPLNRTTSMTYDAAGRVLTSTDPNGNTTTFQYNVLGQTHSVSTVATANTPAETITYAYDLNGRTLSVTDNRGTTSIAYEAGCDRVHSVTDPVTGPVIYTYMPTGEKATITLPGGGTISYNYVPAFLLSSPATDNYCLPSDDPNKFTLALSYIVDDQGRRCDYVFDSCGVLFSALTNETYNSQAELVAYNQASYEYDGLVVANGLGNSALTHLWLSRIQNTYVNNGSSTLISQNVYTYDNIGQRLTNAITDNTGATRTEQYGYDDLNRLTSVNYGDGETQSYQFDAMGNRSSMTDSANGNHSYTYDAANRLTGVDGNAYVNDGNGNTLSGGGRTNTWDSQNRLTQCVDNNGSTTETSDFTYGSDGLRRRAIVNNGTTNTTTDYVLDNDNAVREMQNGAAYATYLTGVSGPVYRRYDITGAVSWYVYDGLGSVIAEVSPTGAVTAGKKYDVYGNVRPQYSTGISTTNHGFVGALGHMQEANTGLIYMRARYYDPVIGRFIREDPGKNGGNWYAYSCENPTNKIDQNGRETDWLADLLACLAILIVVLLIPAEALAALTLAAFVLVCIITFAVAAIAGYAISQLLDPPKKEADNSPENQEQQNLFDYNIPIIGGLPAGEAISLAELGMSADDV